METDPKVTRALEDAVERFVDSGQGTYADARAALGAPTEHDAADFTAAAILGRNEQLAFASETEGGGSDKDLTDEDKRPVLGDYKNGPNAAAWERQPVEQRRKNAAGIRAARTALRGK